MSVSGDNLGCHNRRGAAGVRWVEARDMAKHPEIHWADPQPRTVLVSVKNLVTSGKSCSRSKRRTATIRHGSMTGGQSPLHEPPSGCAPGSKAER